MITSCTNKKTGGGAPGAEPAPVTADKPDSFMVVDPVTLKDKMAIVRKMTDTVVTVNPVTLKPDTQIVHSNDTTYVPIKYGQ